MKTTPLSFKKVPSLVELQSGFPNLKGLFFDMDGTLFNTESYHAAALLQIGAKFNIRPPHSPEVVHGLMMGKADYLVFEIIKSWEGFPRSWSAQDFIQEKNSNLIKILAAENPHNYLLPEVVSLIVEAKKQGLHLALVTSSEKVITEELLRLAQVANLFEQVLTRDDCPRHKPDPWPYVEAMSTAALDPKECLIFEDSEVGLEAAINSGAHVIKVEWY